MVLPRAGQANLHNAKGNPASRPYPAPTHPKKKATTGAVTRWGISAEQHSTGFLLHAGTGSSLKPNLEDGDIGRNTSERYWERTKAFFIKTWSTRRLNSLWFPRRGSSDGTHPYMQGSLCESPDGAGTETPTIPTQMAPFLASTSSHHILEGRVARITFCEKKAY